MAIDPQLEKVIKCIALAEQAVSDQSRAIGARPWLNFATIQKAGKFDFTGVHAIFSRKASNDDYASKRADPDGRQKDIQTAKLSGDYLAALERDYRMRTRSRIRTFVHAEVMIPASNGNGGVVRINTIDWLGRILAED